ncbi:YjcZ family sporulation protein [Cytobacillus dafuensis]|uniref:YjcZ family sporulation protein n=1 Tax=Cytobacillus dafuensis TaxID=1742359 RepID=A0A5B8Z380_CYTDA|nr:YjcZ family sporulation protein [Cytobacillus dafuensis]
MWYGGYGYGGCGFGACGFGGGFALIVVLFILLIIVGAACFSF